ncbi:MAG: acyl-CoA synthetase FdrA [Coprothermobacterota bacterium]|nr:acyl-CoA synthetase FdrA [Coprothermobacterota bacterium]
MKKDHYRDSVYLMQLSLELKEGAGLQEAFVAMGTPANREILGEMGISKDDLERVGPNDLLIAMEAEDEAVIEKALLFLPDLLEGTRGEPEGGEAYQPRTLEQALRQLPHANLVLISNPGPYASGEARRALEKGLHVMIFSDNVPLEEEIALKKLAQQRGLLLMGPDCGTALLNGKPLCFANVVPSGAIGIVGASGTGIQEVSCAIACKREGVSQAIGTGGRDLSREVGGLMMTEGIKALAGDSKTRVIVVISKPPAPEVAKGVTAQLASCGKPSVVCFIGSQQQLSEGTLWFADSLAMAASVAVSLLRGETPGQLFQDDELLDRITVEETSGMNEEQRFLRGLYTGGTLADEAICLLEKGVGPVYSNIHTEKELRLSDPTHSRQNSIIDLGDDYFTRGKPHPMIDPSGRAARIIQEADDPEVAVLLLDLVLGYGSHHDPAGAIYSAVAGAKEAARARGGHLAVIASITGTAGDPQGLERQRETLERAGCRVMASNWQAAALVERIISVRAVRR